jgi:excisionase family DNA binding protein
MTEDGLSKRRLRKNVIPPSSFKLLSVRDIARRYGFHENTVRRWVTEDELRCIRYGPGKKIYITEKDVDRFIKRFYEY